MGERGKERMNRRQLKAVDLTCWVIGVMICFLVMIATFSVTLVYLFMGILFMFLSMGITNYRLRKELDEMKKE